MTAKSPRDREKQRIAGDLKTVADDARELAHKLGLDPYPVNYWVIDHDEMNELIAYGGFQQRYPHWRWGMQYDRQQKQFQYLGGKAFEIVNNDNPSHAFLQMSNSMADQKAVITHVEAHADFFKNNRWFESDPEAAKMLARHSRKIEAYMRDPEIGREAVEKWIDHILCFEDNINQHSPFLRGGDDPEVEHDLPSMDERIDSLGLSENVKRQVFDEEWLDSRDDEDDLNDPQKDLLAFFIKHGQSHDDDSDKAVEYESWQADVLEMLREEAYYFAPQKMTKVMNEGWAAYWESLMMGDENFCGPDELVEYADHQAAVLNSPGFNPYSLGKALWEYIENSVNRREVVDKLLRVKGIEWQTFHRDVDFQQVHDILDRRDSDDLVERNYSLTKNQYQGFIKNISSSELEEMGRYIFDDEAYETVEDALADVDYRAGWNRMFEVRETHNDITFIEEFLSQEFIEAQEYFTYEYNHNTDRVEIASREVEDVRKKLLLKFTNFGKPTIVAADRNHNNAGELLLKHMYNGVMLDLQQVEAVLKRAYELWGRPVNLKTIIKVSADGQKEMGKLFRYDGDEYEAEEVKWRDVQDIRASDLDYDTKPDEWLTASPP